MVSEEKVNCLKQIDLLNQYISQAEKELEKTNRNITQGSIGILLGVLSFILGGFFPLCFAGLIFGLAGIILLIMSLIEKQRTEGYLASAQVSLNQWKERLYRLEN